MSRPDLKALEGRPERSPFFIATLTDAAPPLSGRRVSACRHVRQESALAAPLSCFDRSRTHQATAFWMNQSGSAASVAHQPSTRARIARSWGFGKFCLVQGRVITSAARRVHRCGLVTQVSTVSSRDGSATSRFCPAMRRMVGDRPGVEIRDPGQDQLPGRRIGADAGLRQQLCGGHARFVDVGLPEVCRQGEPVVQASVRRASGRQGRRSAGPRRQDRDAGPCDRPASRPPLRDRQAPAVPQAGSSGPPDSWPYLPALPVKGKSAPDQEAHRSHGDPRFRDHGVVDDGAVRAGVEDVLESPAG